MEIDIKKIKNNVSNFLNKYGMNYEAINIQKCVNIFLKEMQNGLTGAESSLKMLPTFIQFRNKVSLNKPVIVIDAGGTNFRSAVISFKDRNSPVIENFKQSIMPGLKEEVSKEEFFKIMVDNIRGILNASENIGFVFSYPLEIFPDKDGRLIRFTKEIKAKEVEGEFIVKNLLSAIKKQGFGSNKKIILLNDTTASLLASILAFQNREYESYIGLILGTGCNACYIEKNENIKNKFVEDLDKNEYQIINIESGSFSKGPEGKIDLKFNNNTIDPGKNSFEKMFSGAYLGGLATEVIQYGINEKIFSGSFAERFSENIILESRDVDDYLFYPPKNGILAELIKDMSLIDKITTYYLFENLVERAAILASIVLAASIIKLDKGRNPCNPVCIIAEGRSFYNLNNFQSRVDYYLKQILNAKGNYYYEINKVNNAILLGAAVAGLTG